MGDRLAGKVAIVTGAGGGIGKEHALLLAREGAQVVVNDIGLRAGADAASVVAEIEKAGGIAVASADSATWDGAGNVNGRTFNLRGDEVSRYSEPQMERTIYRQGGWSLDTLDAEAPATLVEDLSNPFTPDAYPDLKVFEE